MADDHTVQFTSGPGDVVLEPLAPDVAAALDAALTGPDGDRRAALGAVAARWPRCLDVWAALAGGAGDPVDRYAFARVGYHRGLDQLRASGWRGSGTVRWRDASNRGFLGALDQLRAAAAALGESDEAERCALFLRQLDPDWGRSSHGPPAAQEGSDQGER
jgi:hypothetical protein